ncbi:tetratricopeptide repeat protein [Qipengyuania flava]|uniref:tetratricopeptide repeat protein n=1 Tax=Qipengyuania flava TaxID=192812 RepID=UPI001C63B167|nr:tetratricopeptide repeat protein [Qipengyuania flava]QYJ07420.1 tetratricopeptide repeat protein [Qipengyuania flava]
MIASALALLIMQVGPNPTIDAFPGLPEELRDRPPRPGQDTPETAPALSPSGEKLAECANRSRTDPQAARDYAQRWRESADSQLELAQSAHCLGLAFVQQGSFVEAQRAFDIATDDVPFGYPAYQARLAAMSGNAAMAQGKPAIADIAFTRAVGLATEAADAPLLASVSIDRARALVALDRTEDAALALSNARGNDPANATAWLLSATLSRRLERFDEAREQIAQAALLAPQDPAVGLEAGVIAALSGREDEARRSFESVVLVAPDSEEAAKARGYLEQLQS